MSTRSVLRASTRAVPADAAIAPGDRGDPATSGDGASSVTRLDDARRAARARAADAGRRPAGGARTLAAHRTSPPAANRRGLDAVRAAAAGGAGQRVRRCSRPGCGEEARATLTFSYDNRTALLGPLRPEANPAAYDMCGACSDKMSPPRGWQLADERPPVAPTPIRREFDERDAVAVLADALHGGATRDERGRLPAAGSATVDVTDGAVADADGGGAGVDVTENDVVATSDAPAGVLVADAVQEADDQQPRPTPEASADLGQFQMVLDKASPAPETTLPPPEGPPVLRDVPLPGFDDLFEPRPVIAMRDRGDEEPVAD